MQLTVRNIPEEVKRRLQADARTHRKSLNQTVVDALAAHAGYTVAGKPKRDLSFFTMTAEDAAVIEETVAVMDAADLAAQKAELSHVNRAGHKPLRGPRKKRR